MCVCASVRTCLQVCVRARAHVRVHVCVCACERERERGETRKWKSRQPCSQKNICKLGWLKKGQTSKSKEWLGAKRKWIQREDKAILKPSLITSRDGRDTSPTWKDQARGFIKQNFSNFLSYNAMTLVWEITDEKQQEKKKKKQRRLSPKQEKRWGTKYNGDLKQGTFKVWSLIHVLKKPTRSANQNIEPIYMLLLCVNILATTN